MKKTLLAGTIAVAVLVLASGSAFAEETARPTPNPKTRLEQAEKKVEDLKKKVEERQVKNDAKKTELEQKRKTKNQERIDKFWAQMKRRLTQLIKNEKNLSERIGKKLDERAAAGVDVTELKRKLAAANVLIADAEKALTDADSQISAIVAGNEPKDALKKVQELNKGVMEKIRKAHQALVDVISSFRKAPTKPSPTPTS